MQKTNGRKICNLINIVVWGVCVYSLCVYFKMASETGFEMTFSLSCIIIIQAIVVHLVKSLRLYLIIFENQIHFSRYTVMYAETAFVNLFLPYKIGELYRGYRIGQEMASVVQGYAVALFDRFIDTLALITVTIFITRFWHIPVPPILVFFIVFCVMSIFLYCLFPQLYKYMNHFLIFKMSSENTLNGLYILRLFDKAYRAVNEMARGRFLFLYLFSIIAWFAETGGLIVVRGGIGDGIGDYMMNAILGVPNQENVVYFIVCIVIFATVSVSIRIARKFGRKRDGDTCSL